MKLVLYFLDSYYFPFFSEFCMLLTGNRFLTIREKP